MSRNIRFPPRTIGVKMLTEFSFQMCLGMFPEVKKDIILKTTKHQESFNDFLNQKMKHFPQ